MIEFFSENDFSLSQREKIEKWLTEEAEVRNFRIGEVSYVFCSDEYLHDLNLRFLNHDTLTDVITFDDTVGSELNGEIYISTDRIRENAKIFKVTFHQELARVMVHGLLHLCGLKDKNERDKRLMQSAENEALNRLKS